MRKHHGGRLLGALIICASATLLTVGCKKKEEVKPEGKPAPSASVDRLADGKRLEKSVADWTKRWNDFAPLPTCEKLLEPADLPLCTSTDAALTALKTAVAEKKPEAVVMHAAAELALAAEQANEKLRAVVQAKSAKEAAAGGKPGAAKPTPPPPPPKAAPAGSGKPPALSERLRSRADGGAAAPNPDNAVVEAYGRASRLALRYLSTYLQYGPLPTRQTAFTEFEQLSNKRPAWPGLLRSLREASLMEKDPTLSTKLKDMVTKLRALQPKPTMPASGAIPSGHPPLPGMKPPAGGPAVKPPPPPGAAPAAAAPPAPAPAAPPAAPPK